MVGLIPVFSAILFLNSTVKELSPTPPPRRLCFTLFVACLFAILHKKYSINLHRIQSKDGTWAVEKPEILVLFQITLY